MTTATRPVTFNLAPLRPDATETAKPHRGYHGQTDFEFLDWGLKLLRLNSWRAPSTGSFWSSSMMGSLSTPAGAATTGSAHSPPAPDGDGADHGDRRVLGIPKVTGRNRAALSLVTVRREDSQPAGRLLRRCSSPRSAASRATPRKCSASGDYGNIIDQVDLYYQQGGSDKEYT